MIMDGIHTPAEITPHASRAMTPAEATAIPFTPDSTMGPVSEFAASAGAAALPLSQIGLRVRSCAVACACAAGPCLSMWPRPVGEHPNLASSSRWNL